MGSEGQGPRIGRIGAFLAAVVLLGAYLWMLYAHQEQVQAPLEIVYLHGEERVPPLDPETGTPLWAGPEVARHHATAIQVRREKDGLPTWILEYPAGPVEPLTWEVREAEGQRVLVSWLQEASGLEALVRVSGEESHDLAVVMTRLPVAPILAVLAGPVAILPGEWHEGVPGEVEVDGTGSFVAPWVDRRYRIGELHVTFQGGVAFQARAMDLPLQGSSTTSDPCLGVGGAHLTYDPVHLGQGGLAGALAMALQSRTGADVALLNYLSVRKGLVGVVEGPSLREALPFHNQVVLVTLTGAQVLALLGENTRQDTGYLVVRGLQEREGRWLDDQGVEVDPARSFRVATVDYLATGARGKRPVFLEGENVTRTGLFTDRMAMDLLSPCPGAATGEGEGR